MSNQQVQGLRVKSFFASSFQEAMQQAQLDMGQDALLLNSREALPENRHLGAWEVVFGISGPAAPVTKVPPAKPPQAKAPEVRAAVLPARIVSEPAHPAIPSRMVAEPAPPAMPGRDINRHLEEIHSLLRGIAVNSPAPPVNSNQGIAQSLIDVGLERMLASQIEEAVISRLDKSSIRSISGGRNVQDWDAESLVLETAREIADRFAVAPGIGRVTALVGPPGCGKTTTLVKLAVAQGLQARRPVRLISADTQKIAAVEQLRRYAGILDIPFEAVETTGELADAIDRDTANSLTLIDTPGFSNPGSSGLAGDLARFLSDRQDIDTHLVLTASMRPEDLHRIADRYATFSPAKLLFTKLDETTSTAAILSEAAARQLPLSFFSDGLLIPEDIKPASKERVISPLVRHLPDGLRRVA